MSWRTRGQTWKRAWHWGLLFGTAALHWLGRLHECLVVLSLLFQKSGEI